MSALTSVTIANAVATPTSFTASSAVEIHDTPGLFPRHVILDVTLVSAGEGGQFEFYREFSNDSSTWFREVAQESQGSGTYAMPFVTRTHAWPANTVTDRMSMQWAMEHRYMRVQYRKTSTAAPSGSLTIVARALSLAAA